MAAVMRASILVKSKELVLFRIDMEMILTLWSMRLV